MRAKRMKAIKRLFKILLVVLGSLIIVVVVLMALLLIPQDRTTDLSPMLAVMQQRIDSLPAPLPAQHSLTVGYARRNITPARLTATAGYGSRLGKTVASVQDSIFVRCLVIDNGAAKVAIVSADLLLMPPEVALLLERELPAIGFSGSNTYFGATHTHNSVGHWSRGAMAIMYGSYDDSLVRMITQAILTAIRSADVSKVKALVSSAQIPVAGAVRNRINRTHPVDSLLRVVRIEREDGARLLLLNFTAHATCLSDGNLVLSGDYPGRLSKTLEAGGYDLAMFMAGAVGSHGARTKDREWACVEEMSAKLSAAVDARGNVQPITDSTLWIGRVALPLPEAQFKVFGTWRLRPWVFNRLMGEYPVYLSVVRIGSLVLLGAPCDFSGEFYPPLDEAAAARGMQTMVTSFNGGYIGYVTPKAYYDVNHYETQLMNWYGPGAGEYVTACMEMLLARSSSPAVERP